ncbi:MAG: efflux RND transporter periplasmic adaptor subunit [Acidobacteria bacterium]|nr:efflux RND transporter periplasmic adaptor subunit [Acidobacteriota bacterium]
MPEKYSLKDASGEPNAGESHLSIDGSEARSNPHQGTAASPFRGRQDDVEYSRGEAPAGAPRAFASRQRAFILIAAIALLAVITVVWWGRTQNANPPKAEAKPGEKTESMDTDVALTPEAISGAGIEIAGVTERPAIALLKVTGTVEANQQQMQQVTPLVAGRVERVYVALGDRVRAGAVLALVASPQVAQLHAKLHETEMHLALAERNLARVQRSENRVAVLQAKARLDEAEATLTRTRKLIELGAGAGKDLIAAETAYKTAKAEYDFQSNITLNKELQEARAEVETSRADVAHLKDELRALGASPNESEGHQGDTSHITFRAPTSGMVSERFVNPGAGIEAGKPLFTITNLATVWVIASVPESQVLHLRVGTPAEVRSVALGAVTLSGRITYIDPQLNEETRTAQVRIDVANSNAALKVGMFAEVGFQTGALSNGATANELVVPTDAVQRIGERTVVFTPKSGEAGHFLVRDVELGDEVGGYYRVLKGLGLGDRVVTKGSFTLKSRLMRSQLDEE